MVSTYFNISAFDSKPESDKDHIRAYAREVLSLGALLLEMNDSIHEGDESAYYECGNFCY